MQAECLNRFNFSSVEDMFAAVGFGELSASAIANKITEKVRKLRAKEEHEAKLEDFLAEEEERQATGKPSKIKRMAIQHHDGVLVEGNNNVLFRLAHCCNPLPGDEIIGFITMGRGVTVHRRDCMNLREMNEEQKQRFLEVYWEETSPSASRASYTVEIVIEGYDRNGLLTDVLQVVTPLVSKISNVNGNVNHKTNHLKVRIRIEIQSLDQLEKIMDRIKNVPDVYEVKRA